MDQNQKPCPLELRDFCRREIAEIQMQLDVVRDFLADTQMEEALDAWDGLERRLSFAGNTLDLIARLYFDVRRP